jgi:hypothetical protein
LQEEADGVTPAGFFCIRRRAPLASPALAPIDRHMTDCICRGHQRPS